MTDQKDETTTPDIFGEWWLKKSKLRMPREFYVDGDPPNQFVDSGKADSLSDGYWLASDVAVAVVPLLEENAKLRAALEQACETAELRGACPCQDHLSGYFTTMRANKRELIG